MRAIHQWSVLAGAVSACLVVPAAASTFGSLANFDTVNDTGQSAHGFRIELEDLTRNDVLDVFGLNRNFGTPSPGDVERYGIPSVVEGLIPGTARPMVTITYQATFSSGIWSATTLSGTFNTPGESCWKFGNVGYPGVPCDHFGVSTRGSPSKTTYSWLVDDGSHNLAPAAVGVAIPPVLFTPPSPAQPQQVQAQILAPVVVAQPAVPDDNKANAFWVKIIQTQLPDNVEVNELMGGRFQNNLPAGAQAHENNGVAALGEKAETEYEWQVLQLGNGNVKVDEVTKSLDLAGNPSMAVRFEFYHYNGTFDGEGLVDPQCVDYASGCGGMPSVDSLGAYVGEQIAGFNVQAAVPEPGEWALILGGLAALGVWRRQSERR